MTTTPFNSIKGFSVGATGPQVIDGLGNINALGLSLGTQISFPDGTTQATKPFSSNHNGFVRLTDPDIKILHNPDNTTSNSISNTANFGPTGSYMLLLHTFTFTLGCTLNRILTTQGGSPSGHTGSLLFAVFDVNPSTGFPLNKLYESSEINIVTSNFTRYSSSPNIRLLPGSYWIGFLLNNPSGKAAETWSWSVNNTASRAMCWEVDGIAGVNRFFNVGNFDHLRYRFAGMTLPDVLTHGFTAALTLNTHPPIGWGTSEVTSSARSPYVGVGIEQ